MNDNSKQVVSLSGGSDSTAMFLMMLERGERIDNVVFYDWGMEFSEMYEHLARLERYTGYKITRLYPRKPFEYWMFDHIMVRGKREGQRGCGWSWGQSRWCTREKVDALRRFEKSFDSVCIGFSLDEAKRRAKYKRKQRYPLIEYEVNGEKALEYCKKRGFNWGGLYDHFKSVSCWCCPLKPQKELVSLKFLFPEYWSIILDWCGHSPYPHPSEAFIQMLENGEVKQ